MSAVLHHVVIRCEACGKVLMEGDTYAPVESYAAGWRCADGECVAGRAGAAS